MSLPYLFRHNSANRFPQHPYVHAEPTLGTLARATGVAWPATKLACVGRGAVHDKTAIGHRMSTLAPLADASNVSSSACRKAPAEQARDIRGHESIDWSSRPE